MRDINTIRYSTNPYNVNRVTMAAGIGALRDDAYFKQNCAKIKVTRAATVSSLEALGFTVLPSSANFIFAATDKIPGGELYAALKKRGVLVRHFTKAKLDNYLRITIGSDEEMRILTETIKSIIG